jgi:hypothetical protein
MGGLNLTKTSSCTRRHLLSITAGVGGAAGQPAASPAASSRIEPVTVKRRGVGLRGHDPDRAFAGFTLFSPLPSDNRTVYLIDMQGNVVHTWAMPYPPGQSAYLTERGTLFYNGQIPNESHVGRAPYRGGAVLEMDWNGRILWGVRHADHNHDGIRLRNGNVLLICQKPLPDGFAPKVRGGRPGTEYDNGKMDAPYLVEMTTDGKGSGSGEAGITSIPSPISSPRFRTTATFGPSATASRKCPMGTFFSAFATFRPW